ncbi:MAG TPA: zf-HC2 domain-containing protein [Thermoanaerobaculia bacterium]|nr:zf-HC2 domain-containing protein [Thermoanaerobaculia bacterium]
MNPGLAQHLAPELLSALVDEELDAAEVREVQAHLGSCLHCRQRLDGLRRVAAGLRDLERAALPASFEVGLRRQIALDGAATGLRERLEAQSLAPRRLAAPVGLGFALVLTLAAIGFLFTHALERRQAVSVVVPLSAAAVEGSTREAAGRSFVRQGVAWRETGAREAPVRMIGKESAEGRDVLAEHPDLEPLLEAAPEVHLVWRGELVALVVEPQVGEEPSP